jgi:hypothetical protein
VRTLPGIGYESDIISGWCICSRVNLADKQATVTYDPKKTTLDAIKAAIIEAGYEA